MKRSLGATVQVIVRSESKRSPGFCPSSYLGREIMGPDYVRGGDAASIVKPSPRPSHWHSIESPSSLAAVLIVWSWTLVAMMVSA